MKVALDFEPVTVIEALSSPRKNKWELAIKKEVDEFKFFNTWALVDVLSNTNIIKSFKSTFKKITSKSCKCNYKLRMLNLTYIS